MTNILTIISYQKHKIEKLTLTSCLLCLHNQSRNTLIKIPRISYLCFFLPYLTTWVQRTEISHTDISVLLKYYSSLFNHMNSLQKMKKQLNLISIIQRDTRIYSTKPTLSTFFIKIFLSLTTWIPQPNTQLLRIHMTLDFALAQPP